MPFNYSKLLGRIKECGMTQESLAFAIGTSTSTLSQKLNNKSAFTQREMKNISSLLEIPKEDIGAYFFADEVQKF